MKITYIDRIKQKKELNTLLEEVSKFFKMFLNVSFIIDVDKFSYADDTFVQARLSFNNSELFLYFNEHKDSLLLLKNPLLGAKGSFKSQGNYSESLTVDTDDYSVINYIISSLLSKHFQDNSKLKKMIQPINIAGNIPRECSFDSWQVDSYSLDSKSVDFTLKFFAQKYELKVLYTYQQGALLSKDVYNLEQLSSPNGASLYQEKGFFNYEDLHLLLIDIMGRIEKNKGCKILTNPAIVSYQENDFDQIILDLISSWKVSSLTSFDIESPSVSTLSKHDIYSKNQEISYILKELNYQIQRENTHESDLNSAWERKEKNIDWSLLYLQKSLLEKNLEAKRILFKNLIIYQRDLAERIVHLEFESVKIRTNKTEAYPLKKIMN